jgi:hypothetical protein
LIIQELTFQEEPGAAGQDAGRVAHRWTARPANLGSLADGNGVTRRVKAGDRWLPGAAPYYSPLRSLLELQIIRSLDRKGPGRIRLVRTRAWSYRGK